MQFSGRSKKGDVFDGFCLFVTPLSNQGLCPASAEITSPALVMSVMYVAISIMRPKKIKFGSIFNLTMRIIRIKFQACLDYAIFKYCSGVNFTSAHLY
ncbi:hypothetical protein HNR39_002235 [Glaciimonas immobilis]|uniref:Uncharacterized protein n=1 Tax=Glaciimonas immobilis TaxID=728004 RepID=A0A840RV72_9BURK|nr:hypothetical protein [Glaciimonas immobilis]